MNKRKSGKKELKKTKKTFKNKFVAHADVETSFLKSEKYHSLVTVCSFRMFPWAQEDGEAGALNPVFVSVAGALFG